MNSLLFMSRRITQMGSCILSLLLSVSLEIEEQKLTGLQNRGRIQTETSKDLLRNKIKEHEIKSR